MESYIWESERTIQDVISSFTALTDKRRILDGMREHKIFNYKALGSDGYKFRLWFQYEGSSRYSYEPAYINGTIVATSNGCRIEAHLQRWLAIMGNVMSSIVIALLFAAAIAAPFTGFKGSVAVAVMCGLLATGILIYFLHTRRKWKSKAKNILLEIIDCAAGAERQIL